MAKQPQQKVALPFTVVDVFTETPFSGNPLAIVRLPPSKDFSPSQTQLQHVASEFNLSETIFLEDLTSHDAENHNRRARIFTTTREILFAGHPTIGAATWLLNYEQTSPTVRNLVPGAGPIPISSVPSRPGYVSAIAPHTYHQHEQRMSAEQLLAMHQSLAPHITKDQSFPIVSIVHGMTWALVEFDSLEALGSARLANQSASISADSGILDQGWEYNSLLGVYLFVRNGEAEQDGIETIRTRMLIRSIEDPATGSAASALTGYLAQKEKDEKGKTRQWKIVQGVEMGRRSEIGVQVDISQDDSDMRIMLSGTAVVVSEGTIWVPHDGGEDPT